MPIVELSLIIIALMMGLSIVWSTLIAGMSPMPSSGKARKVMLELVAEAGPSPIIDLGSGWGHLVLCLALKYPNRQVIGYELSFMPWCVSWLISQLLRIKNLTLYRQDFFTANLPSSAIILCYLHPAAMAALKVKLAKPASAITSKSSTALINSTASIIPSSNKPTVRIVISNNFALPNCVPLKTIRLNDFYCSPVYFYRLNECLKFN